MKYREYDSRLQHRRFHSPLHSWPLSATLPQMKKPSKSAKSKKKTMLFGLGLDNKDGHTRITSGDNFKLIGGSEETHGTMQEKAIKMNEHLKRRGKTLDTVSRDEFHDIADKLGMPLLEKQPPAHERN
ncbi:MAG TPA: hypothetical protein VMV72_04740 [Verrucomicrobiae bacterium]|nr:hypothetical protein [Verrucomicrobiae bacterium]